MISSRGGGTGRGCDMSASRMPGVCHYGRASRSRSARSTAFSVSLCTKPRLRRRPVGSQRRIRGAATNAPGRGSPLPISIRWPGVLVRRVESPTPTAWRVLPSYTHRWKRSEPGTVENPGCTPRPGPEPLMRVPLSRRLLIMKLLHPVWRLVSTVSNMRMACTVGCRGGGSSAVWSVGARF